MRCRVWKALRKEKVLRETGRWNPSSEGHGPEDKDVRGRGGEWKGHHRMSGSESTEIRVKKGISGDFTVYSVIWVAKR